MSDLVAMLVVVAAADSRLIWKRILSKSIGALTVRAATPAMAPLTMLLPTLHLAFAS